MRRSIPLSKMNNICLDASYGHIIPILYKVNKCSMRMACLVPAGTRMHQQHRSVI